MTLNPSHCSFNASVIISIWGTTLWHAVNILDNNVEMPPLKTGILIHSDTAHAHTHSHHLCIVRVKAMTSNCRIASREISSHASHQHDVVWEKTDDGQSCPLRLLSTEKLSFTVRPPHTPLISPYPPLLLTPSFPQLISLLFVTERGFHFWECLLHSPEMAELKSLKYTETEVR